MKYVVQSGLTRRLVEAGDDGTAYDALQIFLSDKLLRRHLVVDPEDMRVTLATDAEIAEFVRVKPKPGPDQGVFVLDDVRKNPAGRKQTKGTKEHA